ncbi:MAG: aminotransferase class I/II-fold pyridoxal phosphate-dependent enzyme, partial [Candidatus Paceibacterota bacterium]
MNDPIPYGKHSITEEDIESVVEVLKSNYLTQGPTVAKFENAFAEYIGSKYAIAVSNGTTALHLCTSALNVQSNDRVITTPITFAATGNCVRYQGGEVLFADINSDTYLLDINSVREIIQKQSKTNPVTGIIPVDFAGKPVHMEAYRELADEYGLWIIEDACHAPGGTFNDNQGGIQRCGNGKFADLAIFSFHPVKHIASGEGGMVTTNDEILYNRILKLRSHGITKSQDHFIQSKSQSFGQPVENGSNDYPGWYMEMQQLGYNYRLTE